jgi:glycosyltransferase involved in cell wall biosynthesis
MNIAVLTSLYPSAVRPTEGIFAERRWTAMAARGHQVHVTHPLPRAPFSFGREDWAELGRMAAREEREGIEIERPRYLHLPGRARANARAFASCGLKRILVRGRPDVVVADYAWPAARAAHTLEHAGIPFVISGRGSDVLQVRGEAGLGADLGACLQKAGHWCGVSRDLVGAMDELGGRAGQGVLVPNGVDLERFAPADRVAAREHFGVPRDATLVLVVGHLIERKDPVLAVRAWSRWSQSEERDTRLVLIGRGALYEPLMEEIAKTGQRDAVQIVPHAEPAELARWYTAADVLLLTSWREGRPNVVLEALASGRPVLATEAGGTGELLEGLDGMLARTREPDDLARALADVLAAGHSEETLRAHASQFTWDAGLDALEGCLQGALSS